MKIETTGKFRNGLKMTGLVIFIAALSGCHALPVHHGNSHGYSNSGHYDNGSHNSKHSDSRDY
jgi:hypothetical protein